MSDKKARRRRPRAGDDPSPPACNKRPVLLDRAGEKAITSSIKGNYCIIGRAPQKPKRLHSSMRRLEMGYPIALLARSLTAGRSYTTGRHRKNHAARTSWPTKKAAATWRSRGGEIYGTNQKNSGNK